MAERIALPRAALDNNAAATLFDNREELPKKRFSDSGPFQEFTFPNRVAGKRAIADELGVPLAKLAREQLDYIDAVLTKTAVLERVNTFFKPSDNENQKC